MDIVIKIYDKKGDIPEVQLQIRIRIFTDDTANDIHLPEPVIGEVSP